MAPAHMQSWFNPLLDTPMYLMVKAGLSGAVVGAWLASPIMLSLYFLFALYLRLAGHEASRLGVLSLGVLASTGAATMPAVGASFNDGFVAAGLLGALLLVVRQNSPGSREWFLAGLIAGAMTGLKLTAGVYCLGLAGAACVAAPWREWRASLPVLLALLAGGILGFLLSYGYWGWTLWQLHGNPFFPLFNQIFQSPDALPTSFVDPSHRPRGWLDGLSAPFALFQASTRFSELPLRDPRLLLGLIAGVVLVLREKDNSTGDKLLAHALGVLYCVADDMDLALQHLPICRRHRDAGMPADRPGVATRAGSHQAVGVTARHWARCGKHRSPQLATRGIPVADGEHSDAVAPP